MAYGDAGGAARRVLASVPQRPRSLGRCHMGRTGRIRFQVVIKRRDQEGGAQSTRVGGGQTEHTALKKVCEIIQQWAASEGAITPGTTVSIVDTNDGGILFAAEYLGYEVPLLGRDSQQWPGPEKHPRRTLKAWPK